MMHKTTTAALFIATLLASASGLQAATALTRTGTAGIPYDWGITLGDAGTDSASGHVGAWSWDEDGFPVTKKGWTHTSSWVTLTLTSATNLTVRLESKSGVAWESPSNPDPLGLAGTNLRPSFSLYSGTDLTSAQVHNFNNRGNIEWATGLTYLDHVDNSDPAGVERTWALPAGTYTINLGGNSPSLAAEGRQGYLATFTTSPVPEPSILGLSGILVLSLLIRRRAWATISQN